MVYANNRIITCGGQASCWEYNIKEDSWLNFTQATFSSEYQTGVVVHDGKLYVIDTMKAQVWDLVNKSWSTWPMPSKKFGIGHIMVGWKDSIILIGGLKNMRGVQIFNITSQTWAVKNSANVPMDIVWSSSLLISHDEVLFVGSDSSGYYKSAAKYYPVTDSWLKLPDTRESHRGSRLVQVGARIFVIYGYETDTVEEFFRANNTLSRIQIKPINSYKGYHSVVALPSKLFAHLPGGCKGIL